VEGDGPLGRTGFLDLPTEVREIVYGHLFADIRDCGREHNIWTSNRAGSAAGPSDKPTYIQHCRVSHDFKTMIALMTTCKAIDWEVCPLVYSCDLQFHSLKAMVRFVNGLRPRARSSIKKITLEYSTRDQHQDSDIESLKLIFSTLKALEHFEWLWRCDSLPGLNQLAPWSLSDIRRVQTVLKYSNTLLGVYGMSGCQGPLLFGAQRSSDGDSWYYRERVPLPRFLVEWLSGPLEIWSSEADLEVIYQRKVSTWTTVIKDFPSRLGLPDVSARHEVLS
jgi:hypothetical protein